MDSSRRYKNNQRNHNRRSIYHTPTTHTTHAHILIINYKFCFTLVHKRLPLLESIKRQNSVFNNMTSEFITEKWFGYKKKVAVVSKN